MFCVQEAKFIIHMIIHNPTICTADSQPPVLVLSAGFPPWSNASESMEFMLLRKSKIYQLECVSGFWQFNTIVFQVFWRFITRVCFRFYIKDQLAFYRPAIKHILRIFLMIHRILMLVGSRKGSLSKSNGGRKNKGSLRKLPGPVEIAFISLGACIDCEENPILWII